MKVGAELGDGYSVSNVIDTETRGSDMEESAAILITIKDLVGNEKTYRLKQSEIIGEVDMNTAKHAMDLQLTKFGPYRINYSKN